MTTIGKANDILKKTIKRLDELSKCEWQCFSNMNKKISKIRNWPITEYLNSVKENYSK